MQNSEIEFRFATVEDRHALAALLLESNRHYWGPTESAKSMTMATAEAIVTGSSGCRAIIAWAKGAPAGFATVSVLHPALNEAGTLFMKDLFVSSDARGAGIGERFMRHLAGLAAELGCKRFDWTAETGNVRALHFYDGLGAERVHEKVYFRLAGSNLTDFAR